MKLRTLALALSMLYCLAARAQTTSLVVWGSLVNEGGGVLIVIGDVKLSGYSNYHLDGVTEITGNWICTPTVQLGGAGKLVMKGTTPQQVNSGNIALPSLAIANSTGTFLDSTDLRITDTLEFREGHLFLGDHDLILAPGAVIVGANPNSFIVTNGAGMVIQEVAGRAYFPLGPMPDLLARVMVEADSGTGPVGVHLAPMPDEAARIEKPGYSILGPCQLGYRFFSEEVGNASIGLDLQDVLPEAELSPLDVFSANWEKETWVVGGLVNREFDQSSAIRIPSPVASDTLTFLCRSGDPERMLGKGKGILLGPNPTHGTVLVQLEQGLKGVFRMELVDLGGNVQFVRRINKQESPVEITLELESLATGEYELRLSSLEEPFTVRSQKLILIGN